jgi:DNA repair exonuclease SbcCD ATPase subunit
MAFEQATIKVDNEQGFGELKAAIVQVFMADRITKYLKKLSGQNIRVRDWDAILAAGTIDVITETKLGAARSLYESLTVSDQGQMREFYLSKIEEVDQALRARFGKLYRYY